MGQDGSALSDLTQAIRLSKDYESFHQRGIVYHKMVVAAPRARRCE